DLLRSPRLGLSIAAGSQPRDPEGLARPHASRRVDPPGHRLPDPQHAFMNDALTAQTVELLQQLIRNQCVNDGSVASGQEVRTSDVLRAYLEGSGLDIEVYEPDGAPGRTSLVARIEGTDPAAPTLCLMGHTDVVPVTRAHWTRDPFGGELVNGEVWGRGAIDMLNLTASQAVALRALARRGWRAGQGRGRRHPTGGLPPGAVRERSMGRLRRLARPRPGCEGRAGRSLARRRGHRQAAPGHGQLRVVVHAHHVLAEHVSRGR